MTFRADTIQTSRPSNKLPSKAIKGAKRVVLTAFVCVSLMSCLSLSSCSSTTLPWPDLSVSHDEADQALSKEEQSLLDELLTTTQKNHDKDAVREIESR